MKKLTLSTTVLFLMAGISSFGQLLDPGRLMRRKAEQKINQKIEESVDKAIDKALTTPPSKKDSLAKKNNADAEAAVNNIFKNLDMSGTPKPAYEFGSSMVMKTTIFNPKDNKTTTMKSKYMFSDDGNAMATKFLASDNPDMAKMPESMDAMVFDFEQKKMFTFMNNKGTKSVMAIGIKGDAVQEYAEKENAKVTITKTGQTKTIAGYLCDGYLMDNNGEKMTLWVSQTRVPQISKMALKMSQGNSSPYGGSRQPKTYYNAHPEFAKFAQEGRMTMGYSAKGKNGEETSMELDEIKPSDKSTFSTSEYKPMMGGKP